MQNRHTQVDTEAFEALLLPVLPKAYGTAYHLTHSRDDAEDLVQEASLQAYRAFHTFQPGTNFKAWFFKILINLFRNHCRKRKREPEIAPLDDAPDLYLYSQTAQTGLHKDHDNPAELVLEQMTEAQIRRAITALPNEYQIVCILYFINELAYQEIADMVGVPVGTVRSRLHRGRKLLQKSLWHVANEETPLSNLKLSYEGTPA